MNTIRYYSKNVYGKQLYYIIDETQARLYEILTGDKTLTETKLGALKMLGVGFEEVLPSKN